MSRRKTSATPFASVNPRTRSVANDMNATYRPSAETLGDDPPAAVGTPAGVTLTVSTVPLVRSRRYTWRPVPKFVDGVANTTYRPSADRTCERSTLFAGSPALLSDSRVVSPGAKPGSTASALLVLAMTEKIEKMSATLRPKTLLMPRILVSTSPHDRACGEGFVGGWHAGVYGSQGSPSLGAVLTP